MVTVNNKKKTLIILSIVVAIATISILLVFLNANVNASDNIIHLGDHQTYDISNAPKNSIIQIDDDSTGSNGTGRVTLKGSSDRVWVHVEVSSGHQVTIDMEDGLDIHPGYWSGSGISKSDDSLAHCRSAIYIDETTKSGGTVILNSMKKAKIKLDSYKDWSWPWGAVPAIMKNNTKTKLIFATEDKANPGTIIAQPTYSVGSYGSCAIGAFGYGVGGYATSSYTVGNMVFYSGNVEAYGRVDGPGIGASQFSHVDEISFAGANVIAKAGNWGNPRNSAGSAGIGGSYRSNVNKISISGGSVEAWGEGSTYRSDGTPLIRFQDVAGCGIGSGRFQSHVGEIEITGGTVKAHGGSCARDSQSYCSGSGIGTCVDIHTDVPTATADKITITGGDITAVGGMGACGIGGCVKDIVIGPKDDNTSLNINASIDERRDKAGTKAALGAGIGVENNSAPGTSYRSDYPGNITISGGNIYTKAGGSYNAYGLTESYNGSGIGPCAHGRVSNLTITGGTIYAEGGWNAPGIGGPNGCATQHSQTIDNILISGGTITATKASYNGKNVKLSGIGGYKDGGSGRTNIRITGGNVISNGDDYEIGYDANGQPKNDKDETVYSAKFKLLPDIGEGVLVKSFVFNPAYTYDYGLKDVYTKKGLVDESALLEFWLPSVTSFPTVDAKTQNNAYRSPSSIVFENTNTLYGYTDIDYVNKVTGMGYIGEGNYGDNTLSINPAPTRTSGIMECYELTGYEDNDGELVASGTYGEGSPTLKMGTKYVDDGKWNAKYGELTLKLRLKQTGYMVTYDANKPKGASHDVTGTMPYNIFQLDANSKLRKNDYSLVGWTFKGWNTKADGTGESYVDEQEVNYKDGDHLTLYAVWEAKPYTITFNSGTSGGSLQHTQTVLYDHATKLDKYSDTAFGWSSRPNHDYDLHGWAGPGFGAFYDDNEDIFNIVDIDSNGNLNGRILTAVWVGKGKLGVSVTRDGIPLDVDATAVSIFGRITKGDFILKSNDPTMQNRIELPEPTTQDYTLIFDLTQMPSQHGGVLPYGTYSMAFDPALNPISSVDNKNQYLAFIQKFIYEVGKSVSQVFDYNRITMQRDVHIEGAYVEEKGTSNPLTEMIVPDDESVIVGANAEQGYHFDGYSYFGVEPTWEKGKEVANQSIKMSGTVDITAHASANVYHVIYDKNKPNNATHEVDGSMEKQDFVYDENQALKENQYLLTGWTFMGWNTKSDGKGIALSDNDELNSTKWNQIGAPANNTEVKLYAQWKPNKYTVNFNPNNATSGTMAPMTNLSYDSYITLSKNQFNRTPDWNFVGWNTNPSGHGTSYSDEERVRSLTTDSSITLYAQWEHDYYTVKYDKNDANASGVMPDEHVWTHHAYELPLCNYTKTGYEFESWNTKSDGSGTRYESGDIINDIVQKGETFTLYAQWKPVNYKVIYDANSGSGSMEEQAFIYDTPQELLANQFVKEHYVFKCWNTREDGEGQSFADKQIVDNLSPYPGGIVILYAQWEKESHSISYDLNGGSLDGKTGIVTIQCKYGDTIELPKPTREGYTFKYWQGSRYNAGDKYTVESDHTFTAVWEVDSNTKSLARLFTGDNAPITLVLVIILLGGVVISTVLLIQRNRRHKI